MSWRRFLVIVAGGSCILALPLASPEGPQVPADEDVLRRGAALYDEHCAECHFPDGNAPIKRLNLVDGNWRSGDGTLKDLMRILQDGLVGTQMEPFKEILGDDEIRSISLYVLSLREKK